MNDYTTIAHALAIFYAAPILATLSSWWLLRAFFNTALRCLPATTVHRLAKKAATDGVRPLILLPSERRSASTMAGKFLCLP